MNLLKIESRFQEIILFGTLIIVPAFLFSAFSYVFMNDANFLMIFGNWGSQLIHQAFLYLGFSYFYIPFAVIALAKLIIQRCKNIIDLKATIPSLITLVALQIGLTFVISSYASIFEQYLQFSVHSRLSEGAGGAFGVFIGASLFNYFGLFGSVMALGGFSLLMAIASGHFQFVNFLLALENAAHKLTQILSVNFKSLWLKLEHQVAKVLYSQQRQDAAREKKRIEDEHRQAFENYSHAAFDVRQAVNAHTIEIPFSVLAAQLAEAPLIQEKKNSDQVADPIEKKRKRKLKVVSQADLVEKEESLETPVQEDHEESLDKKACDKDGNPVVNVQIPAYRKKYDFPEFSLLDKASAHKSTSQKDLQDIGKNLEDRLLSFGIKGKVTDVHPGSRLTMFEYLPDSGMKLSKIQSLTTDLALLLGAPSIRILAPIPGKTTVGIEVPNTNSRMVKFSELMDDLDKKAKKMELPIALGLNVNNETIISDLSAMPHLLVSGTTGSGKSVFINTLINSLIFTRSPKDLRFIMIDPKMIELTPYNGIPHLLGPVISDVTYAKDILKWAEREMDLRYKMLADMGARNITSFNEKVTKGSKEALERKLGKKLEWNYTSMPYLVIIVDELADLMITQGKEVEIPITRIAQKARACGIHLVISTQRPSAEIVTGLIKTNFPTRIAFKVSSAIDSRTILDSPGAEKLLGHGDMLFMPNGKSIERLQGAFLSEVEVMRIVEKISD